MSDCQYLQVLSLGGVIEIQHQSEASIEFFPMQLKQVFSRIRFFIEAFLSSSRSFASTFSSCKMSSSAIFLYHRNVEPWTCFVDRFVYKSIAVTIWQIVIQFLCGVVAVILLGAIFTHFPSNNIFDQHLFHSQIIMIANIIW